jgi:hypothetical protein
MIKPRIKNKERKVQVQKIEVPTIRVPHGEDRSWHFHPQPAISTQEYHGGYPPVPAGNAPLSPIEVIQGREEEETMSTNVWKTLRPRNRGQPRGKLEQMQPHSHFFASQD